MKNRTTKKKRIHKFPLKKFFKVTFIYFLLFLALLGMVDYYAMMAYNFALILGIAILLALASGLYHIKRRKHSHVDDVADELL
jgi:LPXTG-motif cell wall-anchored protein